MGLPALETHVQPADKTLVNFDTIFYAEPSPVNVSLTLLGQSVEVVATPTLFRWDFGDGTIRSTHDPGGPYPNMSVAHRYPAAHSQVQAHVAVEYSARFRVGGESWQDIDETVTITGPPTGLAVAEAPAVLSGDHD